MGSTIEASVNKKKEVIVLGAGEFSYRGICTYYGTNLMVLNHRRSMHQV